MPIVFHVTTGNYLHKSKIFTKTIGEAIVHVQNIIDMKPNWVNDDMIHKSYSVTRVDTKLFPNYQEIFETSTTILPPAPPSDSELDKKLPRIIKKPSKYRNVSKDRHKAKIDKINGF